MSSGGPWSNQAQDLVIVGGSTSSGVFVYSPTIGAGNLIAWITNATSDPFGNPIVGTGVGDQNNATGAYAALHSGNIQIWPGSGQNPASIAATAPGTVVLSSPTETVADVAEQLSALSRLASGAGAASGTLQSNGPIKILAVAPPTTGTYLWTNASGTPAAQTSAGLNGTLPITQSDISTTTNANAVGVQPISKQWTIPAGDAKVGTKYEIILPWQATMEATNTLQLGSGLNGAVMTNAVTISAAIVGAGVGIRGTIRGWLKIVTTGAGGTADFFFDGTVQQTGASVTFANSGSIPTQPALAVAFNTTVSNTIQINSQWGGSTAGQTVSGFDSDFIRSGP